MAAPSRRNSGFETTANWASGRLALMIALDLVAGAHRHGGLGDDHGEAVQQPGDLLGGGIDVGEVGVAVAAPRGRAHGDEHRVGLLDRLGGLGVEEQAPGLDVLGHQHIQARLEDRDAAGFRRSILPASLSMQITSWPKSAKQAPLTRPT
jgi:hypothetical protein